MLTSLAHWIELNQVSIGSLILILAFDVVAPLSYRARGMWALLLVWATTLALAYLVGAMLALVAVAVVTSLSFVVLLCQPRVSARVWICVIVSLLALAVAAAYLIHLLGSCQHGCL